MRRGPALSLPPARVLRGSAAAPVRFTEFTDVRCSHCAQLHGVWDELGSAFVAERRLAAEDVEGGFGAAKRVI